MMESHRDRFLSLFQALDARIEAMNHKLRMDGLVPLPKSRIRLLGQISLLVQESVSLALTQTVDVDAELVMDYLVKEELKVLLRNDGLVYDEDSHLIWIPDGAKFLLLMDLPHLTVEVLDPESALVSKAVKAPQKNRQLLRQAIASNQFPSLVDRIVKHGGTLEEFA